MKKINKVLLVMLLCATMIIATMSSASAAIVYHHGNESGSRCFAKTTQTSSTRAIGAKITWQISGSSVVKSGDQVTSTGAEALSRSSWLWRKSGKSFGYYYIDGIEAHRSTAWLSFDF